MILMGAVRRIKFLLGTAIALTVLFGEVLIGGGSLLALLWAFLLIFLLLFALALVYFGASWYACTYRFEEGHLILSTGILFKKERSVKRERVQSVNTSADVLQRLFGVATLEVKTAGTGEESGLTLIALPWEEIQRISALLETSRPEPSSAMKREGEVVYHLPAGDLLLAGITSGQSLILFSFLAVVFSQVYGYIPEHYMDRLVELATSLSYLVIIIAIVILLLISWLISILVFAIRYANFTLRRHEDRLDLSWGIIEQRHMNVSLRRVQAVSIREELLMQLFGLCSVNMEVAGEWSGERQEVKLLYPLLRSRELPRFLEGVLPEYKIPDSMSPLPKHSLRRYLIRSLVPTLALVALLQLAPYGFLTIPLIPIAALLGISRYRTGRISVGEGQLTLRFRNLNRYLVMMRREHVQSMEVSANPFQRLSGLRTLKAAVLSSMSGRVFTLKDIELMEARRVWNWYSSHG